MGFDDIFDQDRRGDRRGYDNRYRQTDHQRQEDDLQHDDRHGYDDRFRQNYHSQSSTFFGPQDDLKQQFLDKLRANPQLKILIIAGVIIIAVVVIVLAIILIPFILKLFGYVGENGIQGLINTIWKGTK
jgi:hypothetical protein